MTLYTSTVCTRFYKHQIAFFQPVKINIHDISQLFTLAYTLLGRCVSILMYVYKTRNVCVVTFDLRNQIAILCGWIIVKNKYSI